MPRKFLPKYYGFFLPIPVILIHLFFFFLQWEALALLLIGISLNQLQSLPAGSPAVGLSVAMGAYLYTLIFVCILYTCPVLICLDFVPFSYEVICDYLLSWWSKVF